MASFGPRRLLKVRKGGLLYKFWRPAIPRGVRPLKRVQSLQKLIRDILEVAHGQFWSQEAAEGQARYLAI